jgi:gluconate kinase
MTVFVLMGVSGSGKSSVGSRVAGELAFSFVEGDDFHRSATYRK